MSRSRAAIRPPSLALCHRVALTTISDPRGHLTIIEGKDQVPFAVRRLFWAYGGSSRTRRGGHAHRRLYEFVVCVHGRIDLAIDNGIRRRVVRLDRPNIGVLIPPRFWVEVRMRRPDSIYLVLASDRYRESDYYRDRAEYLREVGRSNAR